MSTQSKDITATRTLRYDEAVREAIDQEMERDPDVFVLGIGVDDAKAIYNTTAGLVEKYGPDRIFDTPLAEDAMTGVAIGAAQAGLRPIHVHIRMDFALLAMNQIINMAAKSHYMFGGSVTIPMVIRVFVGRSWGSGPQHSQALHSLFMHIPGLKVVAPANPYDAKGILVGSIRDNNPVVVMEHRLLAGHESEVPEELYTVPFGKARTMRQGKDLTIVGVSYMALESFRAAEYLEEVGIDAEVIDPVSLSPLDIDTITESAKRTGRLLVVDNGWLNCGTSAEIITRVVEAVGGSVSIAFKRMGFAEATCPTTPALADLFYPNARSIAISADEMVSGKVSDWVPQNKGAIEAAEFRGPF